MDSLAIAIGTCHGIYPSWMKPELKLDLLEKIKAKVSIPLVLHGGSNNPDSEIGQSVKLGINKINISSDIKVAYHDKMREVLTDTTPARAASRSSRRCIAGHEGDGGTQDRPVRRRGQGRAVLIARDPTLAPTSLSHDAQHRPGPWRQCGLPGHLGLAR